MDQKFAVLLNEYAILAPEAKITEG